MSLTHCNTCTQAFPVHAPGYCGGTGYAILPDDSRICYPCADAMQRAEIKTADVYGVYLSSSGNLLTTWTGGQLAVVTRETTARTGFHGTRITYIRARTPDGAMWYGKGAGRGMCLTVRRAKGWKVAP